MILLNLLRNRVYLFLFSIVLLSSHNVFAETFTTEQLATLKEQAEIGDTYSQYNLAFAYQNGNVVEKDLTLAKYWYLKAAKSPHTKIRYKIGRLYETGGVLEKNINKAISHYIYAAEHEEPLSQNNLALLYLNGNGVTKSITKAVEWLSKAADKDFVKAQINLALIYQNILPDKEKALFWFDKAAQLGSVEAQYQLGQYFQSIRDFNKAYAYYLKAAEKDHNDSQLMVALFYAKGLHTKKDREMARQWLKRAAENGNSRARKMLNIKK